MEIKDFKVQIPNGYKIDKENSTFECIKFKKKNEVKEIHTWDDFVKNNGNDYELWLKANIASLKIEKLFPFFGGKITCEEWFNKNKKKYVITGIKNKKLDIKVVTDEISFLSFRSVAYAYQFVQYDDNAQLVEDYLSYSRKIFGD